MNTIRQRLWEWRWPLLAGAITLLGLALRVWKAWSMRYSVNGDFGIVALMARHMAMGTDYPALCYGMAYMGGLEPGLATLLALVFRVEVSAFVVNLGTALVGALLLPVLYVFGRDAGSRRAGLMAMLYCLVGSDTNFHYAVAPRGGYMSMMVGGLLALWVACRIATRARRGAAVPWLWFLGMGLAAGLAWWATQLSIVFLAAAGAVLLLANRWSRLWRGAAPALVGFLLGGLPWWTWNLTHHWGSFDFGGSLGRVPFREGLTSFGQLFLQVVEVAPRFTGFDLLRGSVLAGMIVYAAGLLLSARNRASRDERFFFRMAIPFLALFMVLAYSTSHYVRAHASRYLLPIVPGVALVAGLAGDALLRRFRWPWGWVAFLLILPPHILSLPGLSGTAREDRPRWDLAARLEAEAAPECDGLFLGDYYQFHWINFASRERVCVASPPAERYAPYAKRAELAERPAYLADYGTLHAFLHGTRGASRQKVVGGVLVDYDVTPAAADWDYVEPAQVVDIRDAEGRSCRDALLDLAMDSSRMIVLAPHASESLTFTLRDTVPVCGLRWFSQSGEYPREVSIEGRAASEAPWVTLLPGTETTPYFWSGSYVKLDGVQYFQEFRFPVPAGGIRELRVTFLGSARDEETLCLSEVLLLRQTADVRPSYPAVARCVEAVRAAGTRECYAPRWLAERLVVATSNTLTTLVPSSLARTVHEVPVGDSICPHPLQFARDTALFMDARDAPRSREALGRVGLSWREMSLGTITLLAVRADPAAARDGLPRGYWTEHGYFGANENKERAQMAFSAAGSATNRVELLQEALRLYPRHQPARQALIEALTAAGRADEAARQVAELRSTTLPASRVGVRFANGVELLGLNVVPTTALPGQWIELTYFWKCPASVDSEKLAAFVHLTAGANRFQDDHVLLRSVPPEDLRYQPFDEVFTEVRPVAVPAALPPGTYRVSMGLLDRTTEKRLHVKTELPQKRNAVALPVEITIKKAGT